VVHEELEAVEDGDGVAADEATGAIDDGEKGDAETPRGGRSQEEEEEGGAGGGGGARTRARPRNVGPGAAPATRRTRRLCCCARALP
jgi:hypothetical protein